jgi:hypothetical protein
MSEWSPYIRVQENRDWTTATGPLSEIERVGLSDVKEILTTFNYNKPVGNYRNIFEFFAVADELPDYKTELMEYIDLEHAEAFLEAMEILRPRFEKIWAEQYLHFEQKQAMILDNLHQKEILVNFEKLLGIKEFPQQIGAYLVINTKPNASGGANIGLGRITLECSSAKEPGDIMTVFWHEVAHLIIEDFVNEVYELTGKQTASREFINESIAHSLFGTFGALSHRYFPSQNRNDSAKLVDKYVETGEVSESGKSFIDGLPFGLGPYYLSKFIEGKLATGSVISPQDTAKEIVKIHAKA